MVPINFEKEVCLSDFQGNGGIVSRLGDFSFTT